jgi:hypothetical protein
MQTRPAGRRRGANRNLEQCREDIVRDAHGF